MTTGKTIALARRTLVSKEIEENNRMEETRDLFKKIRDTKGTFHAKMGLIKDRNGTEKGPSSQGYGFPVVMYGCESWTVKKAER